jgi:hypothetical protein
MSVTREGAGNGRNALRAGLSLRLRRDGFAGQVLIRRPSRATVAPSLERFIEPAELAQLHAGVEAIVAAPHDPSFEAHNTLLPLRSNDRIRPRPLGFA